MPDIWFYHLETTSLEQVLPDLLEKTVQRGWRAYVHGDGDDVVAALDSHLWSYRPDSFLAHGREGDELAAHQPVLLGTGTDMTNRPDVYLSVSPVEMPDVRATQRCLIVFDGNDADHLSWARTQWKRLKAEGGQMAYWKQTGGKWEKMQ